MRCIYQSHREALLDELGTKNVGCKAQLRVGATILSVLTFVISAGNLVSFVIIFESASHLHFRVISF